jgi:hypothetical protein
MKRSTCDQRPEHLQEFGIPEPPLVVSWDRGNLWLLAIHQIFFRLGWLFKTETVVIPALVDYVAGPAWVRGWLPVLSRLGQSLPPLLFCSKFSGISRFKWWVAYCTGAMSGVFLLAVLLWISKEQWPPAWVCPAILILYFAFFVANGFYQVFFGSLQGKLIPPERRGLLLQLSTFLGTIPAVVLGWLVLRKWFADPEVGFGYIFLAAAGGFALSAIVSLVTREPKTPRPSLPGEVRGNLTWSAALAQDANLRWLLVICLFASAGWMLTPHYQAFGRARFEATPTHLTYWVITQSIAVGVFSLVAGPLADRRGNRLAMRILIFGSAASPLFALAITSLPSSWAGDWYWLVYLPLGLAPLVTRVILNYALELCEPAFHPTYQSIANLGLALPLVFSPLFGWLIDVTSFELVFAVAAFSVLLAGGLTFRLTEPRYRVAGTSLPGAQAGMPE